MDIIKSPCPCKIKTENNQRQIILIWMGIIKPNAKKKTTFHNAKKMKNAINKYTCYLLSLKNNETDVFASNQ